MASVVIFIRGDYRVVNQFIQELSAKYLEFTYQESDGKGGFIVGTKRKYNIPISVRYLPLGAWEIVFPIEHKDLALTTILGKKVDIKGKSWIGRWSWMNKYLWPLRKAMSLKSIPNYDDSQWLPLFREGVHIIPVGYKEDVINSSGNEDL